MVKLFFGEESYDIEFANSDRRIIWYRKNQEEEEEDDYDIKPSDIVKKVFLFHEASFWEDTFITPLYEKIQSREEILNMELVECIKVVCSINRVNERQEAIRKWEEFKKGTIRGDDLPQLYTPDGKAIEKKPTREGIVRRLKIALGLDD